MAEVDEYEPACCDPAERRKAGHHAATCTDAIGYYDDRDLALTVACPTPKGCGRPIGKKCETGQGYPSRAHRVRLVVARGGQPTPVKKAARPSHHQADMLKAAMDNGGVYWLCGYNFSGVDRLRRTMRSCETKGWFEFRESGQHEDRYELTLDGREAWRRYDDWMHGRAAR
jgi:hypothetical protein